ncbi:hypothetical protein EVAR_7409_1 [Eumeta japonica]|uniref:Uncharacterized protein n=1 Tax=Eumeta variegata TaxID=151549 RepID=A0A4C1V7R0_EUMVA|nr:hypothetical protein EVAR_7409_1 [Eumeta japonica]
MPKLERFTSNTLKSSFIPLSSTSSDYHHQVKCTELGRTNKVSPNSRTLLVAIDEFPYYPPFGSIIRLADSIVHEMFNVNFQDLFTHMTRNDDARAFQKRQVKSAYLLFTPTPNACAYAVLFNGDSSVIYMAKYHNGAYVNTVLNDSPKNPKAVSRVTELTLRVPVVGARPSMLVIEVKPRGAASVLYDIDNNAQSGSKPAIARVPLGAGARASSSGHAKSHLRTRLQRRRREDKVVVYATIVIRSREITLLVLVRHVVPTSSSVAEELVGEIE